MIKFAALPGRLNMIKFRTLIFVYLQSGCTVAFSERTTLRKGRNTLQPWVNNSLILNLNWCQKKQLNPGRISLLKRKAPHRRKRIQRKKHGKVNNAESPVQRAGLFFMPLFECWFRRGAIVQIVPKNDAGIITIAIGMPLLIKIVYWR